MSSETIISIIIPVYNAEKHIEQCLRSILSQTFTNFEIICIDDGSTDKSLSVLKKQAKFDERIKIFTQENNGPGNARNLGINNAKGSFICFIDIDDCFSNENALMNLILAQNEHDSDLVIGKISVIDSNSYKQIKIRGWNKVKSNILYKVDELYNNLFQCISAPVFAKLYKKEIIKSNNITFNNYKAGEDMLFVYTYVLNCNNLVFIDDLIINYNVLQINSLSSFNSIHLLDSCYAYKDLGQAIQRKNLNNILNKTLLISYIYCFGYVLKRVSLNNKIKIIKKFCEMGSFLICK